MLKKNSTNSNQDYIYCELLISVMMNKQLYLNVVWAKASSSSFLDISWYISMHTNPSLQNSIKMANCDVRVNIYIYFLKYKIKHSSICKRVFVLYTIKKNTDISTHSRCVLSGLFFNPTWPTFHDNFHVLPNNAEHCIAGDVLGNDILFCPCSAGKLVEILTGSDFRV